MPPKDGQRVIRECVSSSLSPLATTTQLPFFFYHDVDHTGSLPGLMHLRYTNKNHVLNKKHVILIAFRIINVYGMHAGVMYVFDRPKDSHLELHVQYIPCKLTSSNERVSLELPFNESFPRSTTKRCESLE